jgi:ribosomal protein L37AE/L43A
MSKVYNLPVVQSKSKPLFQDTPEKLLQITLELVLKLMEALKCPRPFSEHMSEILEKLNYFRKLLGDQVPESLQSLLSQIYSSIQCSSCVNSSVIRINCGHMFCESCLNLLISEASDLRCSICSLPFSPFEISEQFASSYLEEFGVNKLKKCFKCARPASDDLKCGDYCSQCVAEKYWKNNCFCEKCSFQFEPAESLFEKQVLCSWCKEVVYMVGDFTFHLENHQTYCLSCLKQVKDTGECACCRKCLSDLEMQEVEKFLLSQCVNCKTEKTIENFLPKHCCSEMICFYCQGDNLRCTLCKTLLNGRSLSLLSLFYSSI